MNVFSHDSFVEDHLVHIAKVNSVFVKEQNKNFLMGCPLIAELSYIKS